MVGFVLLDTLSCGIGYRLHWFVSVSFRVAFFLACLFFSEFPYHVRSRFTVRFTFFCSFYVFLFVDLFLFVYGFLFVFRFITLLVTFELYDA